MPGCNGHHEVRKSGFHKGHCPFGGGLGLRGDPVWSPISTITLRRGTGMPPQASARLAATIPQRLGCGGGERAILSLHSSSSETDRSSSPWCLG